MTRGFSYQAYKKDFDTLVKEAEAGDPRAEEHRRPRKPKNRNLSL